MNAASETAAFPKGGAIPCPSCGGTLTLKDSRYGAFYGCNNWPRCNQTHGAHPDGSPLGTPADKETREARIRAHAAFDSLWQGGKMKRKAAYRWMQEAMGLSPKEAHIGGFNIVQCNKLVSLIERAPEANSPESRRADPVVQEPARPQTSFREPPK